MRLFGPSRITNYLHLMFAGHIRDILFTCGSLWQFQAQGWEALNGAIKTYVLRCTTRGGGFVNFGEGLCRWSSRRLLTSFYPDVAELEAELESIRLTKEFERRSHERRGMLAEDYAVGQVHDVVPGTSAQIPTRITQVKIRVPVKVINGLELVGLPPKIGRGVRVERNSLVAADWWKFVIDDVNFPPDRTLPGVIGVLELSRESIRAKGAENVYDPTRRYRQGIRCNRKYDVEFYDSGNDSGSDSVASDEDVDELVTHE